MRHVRDLSLNMDERSLLCQIINHVGGDGPYADDKTIAFFTVDFCVACTEKALQKRSLTHSGQLLALTVKSKLKERAEETVCPGCKKKIFKNEEMQRDDNGREWHPKCLTGFSGWELEGDLP